jgi:hypothetical protein
MKHIFLIASAAALFASPAFAGPGQGHGKQGHGAHGKNQSALGQQGHVGYGTGGCPPGLAKKGNGCQPPGLARQRYSVGQRLPNSYSNWLPYNQVPYDLRSQSGYDPYGRYAYDQGTYYQVDPTSMIVRQVLGSVLR